MPHTYEVGAYVVVWLREIMVWKQSPPTVRRRNWEVGSQRKGGTFLRFSLHVFTCLIVT